MKIRVARYKDKEGVDFEDEALVSLKNWSTQGRWYYAVSVEQGEWSKAPWDSERSKFVPGKSNSTLKYDPQIHNIEIWPRPIHVPPFMNRMSFALCDLSRGVAMEFIEGLKQLVAQACAMGAGDTHKESPQYLRFRRDNISGYGYEVMPLFK